MFYIKLFKGNISTFLHVAIMCMNLLCQNVVMILIIFVIFPLLISKYCGSHIRTVLLQRYSTSFYETQMLPHFDTNTQDMRIAIRRVWCILLRTHTNMLAHVAMVMETEFWFAKRCIKFIKMALMSENDKVCTISNMSRYYGC